LEFVLPGARRVFARFQLNAAKALAEAILVQVWEATQALPISFIAAG